MYSIKLTNLPTCNCPDNTKVRLPLTCSHRQVRLTPVAWSSRVGPPLYPHSLHLAQGSQGFTQQPHPLSTRASFLRGSLLVHSLPSLDPLQSLYTVRGHLPRCPISSSPNLRPQSRPRCTSIERMVIATANGRLSASDRSTVYTTVRSATKGLSSSKKSWCHVKIVAAIASTANASNDTVLLILPPRYT